MVSTWRFYSFKDIDFRSRHPFRLIVLLAALFAFIFFYSREDAFRDRSAVHDFRRVLALAVDLPPTSGPAASFLQGGFAGVMSDSVKPIPASQAVVVRGKLYRAAIVGAGSLKGKEVAEMLNERNFPAADIRLLDDDEAMGQLEAMGDEISFIQRVRAEQFDNVDFTFFASDQDSHASQLERCSRRWKRHHRLVGRPRR